MRNTLALVCDSANMTADGKLNILGVFSEIKAHRFPATHPSMTIVLKFNNILGDDGELLLSCRFLSSDGVDTIAPINMPVNLGQGQDEAVSIINISSLEFPKVGDYCFEISAGQEHLASVPIKARSIQD